MDASPTAATFKSFFFLKYYLFIHVSFGAGFPSVAQAHPKSAIWHSMGQTQSSPLGLSLLRAGLTGVSHCGHLSHLLPPAKEISNRLFWCCFEITAQEYRFRLPRIPFLRVNNGPFIIGGNMGFKFDLKCQAW